MGQALPTHEYSDKACPSRARGREFTTRSDHLADHPQQQADALIDLITGSVIERIAPTAFIQALIHDADHHITHHPVVNELEDRCATCHRARHAAQRQNKPGGTAP